MLRLGNIIKKKEEEEEEDCIFLFSLVLLSERASKSTVRVTDSIIHLLQEEREKRSRPAMAVQSFNIQLNTFSFATLCILFFIYLFLF